MTLFEVHSYPIKSSKPTAELHPIYKRKKEKEKEKERKRNDNLPR
jgi:hypothetical protein